MTRARKPTGRIFFVGAGPSDPGLLTIRASGVLAAAELVIVEPLQLHEKSRAVIVEPSSKNVPLTRVPRRARPGDRMCERQRICLPF